MEGIYEKDRPRHDEKRISFGHMGRGRRKGTTTQVGKQEDQSLSCRILNKGFNSQRGKITVKSRIIQVIVSVAGRR